MGQKITRVCCSENADGSDNPFNGARTGPIRRINIPSPHVSSHGETSFEDDTFSSDGESYLPQPPPLFSQQLKLQPTRNRSASTCSTSSSAVKIIRQTRSSLGMKVNESQTDRLTPVGEPLTRTKAFTSINNLDFASSVVSDDYISDQDSSQECDVDTAKGDSCGTPELRRTVSFKGKSNTVENYNQTTSFSSTSPVSSVDSCPSWEVQGAAVSPVPSFTLTRQEIVDTADCQKPVQGTLAQILKEGSSRSKASPVFQQTKTRKLRKNRHRRTHSSNVTSSSPLICLLSLEDGSPGIDYQRKSFEHRYRWEVTNHQ